MTNTFKASRHFKWYYEKGYITARDGNACFVDEENWPDHYFVSRSGARKHKLSTVDFMLIDKKGKPYGPQIEGHKTSIETAAHVEVLNETGKKASVHVHSPNTVALAALFGCTDDRLVDSLNKNWPELFRYTKVGFLVGFQEPGSLALHTMIASSMMEGDVCIMQNHGVLAAGDNLDECMDHIVRLEHISTILLKIVTASGKLDSIL